MSGLAGAGAGVAARRAPFPAIEVAGSFRAMGEQHGRAARGLIEVALRYYRERFERDSGLAWPRVLELAADVRGAIAAYDADAMAEIEGIADGAGYAVDAIVALNARTELLALAAARASEGTNTAAAAAVHDAAGPDECTAAAVLPGATADGRVLLGRNWDQNLRCLDHTLVVRARPDGARALGYLTEAGILIREGVNDAGVGVTGNLLACDRDGRGVAGMPVAVVRRRMLRADRLADAVAEGLAAPVAHSVNHLLADAAGGAVDLETTPGDVFQVQPDDDILVHANHFRHPDADGVLCDTAATRSPSSFLRYRRVREQLDARHGWIGVADLQAAFRDHDGYPDSVCNHPSPEAQRPESGSVASIVMDLTEREMWIAPHPVCENPYTRYALP